MRLDFPFMMAPMAEITTPALRCAVREYSPDVILHSEMLSAAAIVAGAQKNSSMAEKHPFDDPLAYQILGSDPSMMADAAAILCEKGCFAIDINMGCSAPDILKKGQGACLIRDPHRARAVVESCRKAVSANLSVKMRTGFRSYDDVDPVGFAKMLEDSGADYVTVHPRYAKLGFKRTADWEITARIKRALKIPVIGNGDITSPATALERMRSCGCDGIMIGREAVKSPWIFRLCSDMLGQKGRTLEVDIEKVFVGVLENTKKYLPAELHKSRGLRFGFYFSGNAVYGHSLFTMLRKHPDLDGMIGLVREYYRRNPAEKTITFINGIPSAGAAGSRQ